MDSTKGKGQRRSTGPNRIIVSTEPTGAQNNGQARNSGNGQHDNDEVATGSIIGAVRVPYDNMPHDIFDDERLGPTALGILCYVFSRPPNWDVSAGQLNRRFPRHRLLNRKALKQIEQTGWGARAVLFGTNGKPCGGQMWFFRRSLSEPWPTTFMSWEFEARKLHFISKAVAGKVGLRTVRKPTRLNNTDTASKLTDDTRFGFEGYQYQPKHVEAVAAALRRLNGGKPVKDHRKWPEFCAWCYRQPNIKGGRGRPTVQGFWTWLAKQHPYWRDKVAEPDEQPGYVLDGQFYPAAKANMMLAENPKLVGFRPAVKLPDGTVRTGVGK